MFSFISWKFGEKTIQPHKIPDITAAHAIFNNLLIVNSKVQLLLNGNIIKEEINPSIPNNSKAKVLPTNG